MPAGPVCLIPEFTQLGVERGLTVRRREAAPILQYLKNMPFSRLNCPRQARVERR